MEWYLKVWKNCVNFKGRARRKEYWMFNLIDKVITVGAFFFLKLCMHLGEILEYGWIAQMLGVILLIGYILAAQLPALAVTFRRLHDTGKSGWLILLEFIPTVGSIILLVFLTQEGQITDNKYGSNPKGLAA